MEVSSSPGNISHSLVSVYLALFVTWPSCFLYFSFTPKYSLPWLPYIVLVITHTAPTFVLYIFITKTITSTMTDESRSLENTPTWVVAVVCLIIVLISLLAERSLHRLGKFFKHKRQDALYEALEKLKEELMLLGFISLLFSVFQGSHLSTRNGRRLLSQDAGTDHCASKGKVQLLSLEALHQLHIFIFVLAVVHVIFCATTMVLGGAKVRLWKQWENSARSEVSKPHIDHSIHVHHRIFLGRAGRYWRKFTVISGTVAFFKQFYGSVSKSDYIALRTGFIRAHCPSRPDFDFHDYMLRTLEIDFKKIVGISWYLWLFAIVFLLMNIAGWHTYFWLSFLPLILLLLVGAKLEHIITELAKELAESRTGNVAATQVKPSDEWFWFHRPALVLYLIHFILFQNSFEIAFFFWVWCTYGFRSCIMEELAFIIPRLVIGVIVQVLCSYSTLPLYAIVTQMGSMFKQGMFDAYIQGLILDWAKGHIDGNQGTRMDRMANESFDSIFAAEQPTADEEITASSIEFTHQNSTQISLS